jgi:hypothetical protein
MDRQENEDRLSKMLYHLGKGIWKSIPFLGPIVDEVIYVQFQEKLKGELSKHSEEELKAIISRLPGLESIEKLESQMAKLSNPGFK